MPLELVTLPCLDDNYAYLLHDAASGATALIDVPQAEPIAAALSNRGWALTDIWITHHHWDHIDGLPNLAEAKNARVVGAAADAHRLPKLDLAVADGARFRFGEHEVRVIDVSGHTVGHIAFYVADAGAAFTADSLMGLGCGRLFEGAPPQMWDSLSRLMALPDDTLICSGHEYSEANLRFAMSLDDKPPALLKRGEEITAKRAKGLPTIPTKLALEKATNPFLRAADPALKAAVGLPDASDEEVFAEVRARRDRF